MNDSWHRLGRRFVVLTRIQLVYFIQYFALGILYDIIKQTQIHIVIENESNEEQDNGHDAGIGIDAGCGTWRRGQVDH